MKGEQDTNITIDDSGSPGSSPDAVYSKNSSENFVIIGRVTGVHGVRGHIKIQSFTNPLNELLKYKNLYWDYGGSWQLIPAVKNSIKISGDFIVLNIVDCIDRDVARKYQFTKIAVLRSELPKLDDGQYYWSDLEGLKVYTNNTNGTDALLYLGKVDHLFETGANDVMVVKGDLTQEANKSQKSKEYLIPYIIDQYVIAVDLARSSIIVDWDPEF